jgi:DNA polymerase I
MDFELHPTVTLRPHTFNALVAPREAFIEMLNRKLDLQRFSVLYVCGNYSGILSRLDRRFTDLELRRAFTVFQLMTVLEEAHHSLIFIEHDPLIYEDAAEMAWYLSKAMRETAHEASVLLYAPGIDPFFEDLVGGADRVFYFQDGPRVVPKLQAKVYSKMKNQTTLGSF